MVKCRNVKLLGEDNNYEKETDEQGFERKLYYIYAGDDFVFDDNYELPALDNIESYIKENKHLPDIPSADEMIENGLELGDMQIKLLQKVEELTLYIIEQDKKIKKLENEVDKLKEE